MKRALLVLVVVGSACAAGPSIESDNEGNILMRIGREGGRLRLVPFGADENEAAVDIATVQHSNNNSYNRPCIHLLPIEQQKR